MKSYLSLIPISAKVRKRQNRMMILCIIISVLLVTTIFSAADMIIRGETVTMQAKHGNWHIQVNNISDEYSERSRTRGKLARLFVVGVFALVRALCFVLLFEFELHVLFVAQNYSDVVEPVQKVLTAPFGAGAFVGRNIRVGQLFQ